ncbi:MAG: transcriptional repressor [Cyanobacteria bacterium]|nr:transcriptional repressor [Cyanobacteria bacterium CG_2015-16_32_12]NCO77322.1 transcriptional repressor [Cyanobacteria bacterium CG_2015-22_32_23]NCQ05485.1 transcriptional repressor [Cyanobacteria bacterium CG_2015-09_32_10]NCQ42204.1 transcriptional repressor [Cyanobacteria bacterium CG_2015-04_32_10]NCS84169.1 transcriptional repressor [Cyanobacteria bacterium CG_2015-02_32_10]
MHDKNTIIQSLKSKGLRVTPQRFAVYANLLQRTDHPTAEQILLDLNQDVPTLSQATIYLSLQTLHQTGLVRQVLLEEGVCRYDANISPHHHFRCLCCGKIEDIAWESFSNLTLDKLRSGLKVDKYEVIVEGKCDNCL